MLTQLIFALVRFQQHSSTYKKTKRFFYHLLEDPESRLKSRFDKAMIMSVLFSVFLLIDEVDTPASNFEKMFEHLLIALFILEYLLRAWLYNDVHHIILTHQAKSLYLNRPMQWGKVAKIIIAKKIEYMLTPLAIIDLLAILPSFRSLTLFRALLIFRLFKLFRYFKSLRLFAEIIETKRFELYTLAVFLGFLIFIGTVGIYLFEHAANGQQVRNLFDAVYWSIVTVTSVGYGDIAPQTTGGRLVAIGLILTGFGVLSFLISIIVSAVNDKMNDLRENSIYAELKGYKSFVIICGFGRVGQHIAKQLEKHKQHFIIIDNNPVNAMNARRLGYLVIHDDASKNDVLINAGIKQKASAVLCTTGDDVVNVYITLTSRYLNPSIRIITRANHPQNVNKLYQAGADNVIQPFEIAALVVAQYIGKPVAFEAILGVIREEKQFIMETLAVCAGSMIDGITIAELDFEHRKLMLIGVVSSNPTHQKHKNSYALKNQQFYFNPPPFFILQPNDLLVVLGRDISIAYFREQLKNSKPKEPKR